MSDAPELSAEEREILHAALAEPLMESDPVRYGLCLRLCGRRLLQRAGAISMANGWRGSPHAFIPTREGWSVLKAEPRHAPVRQVG
jgi:hypothetical protein